MPRLGATRLALLAIVVASFAGLAQACKSHQSTTGLAGPSGNGGTLTASIAATPTGGRAPVDVVFTSDVNGGQGPYRYLWTFGDGRTSTAPNPRVQFLSGGTFAVQLQVSAGDQTATAGPLTLRFDSDIFLTCAADPIEGVAPVTVSFAADARGGSGPFTYRWDFGDGTTSTATTATHTYATAGTYRQVLTVTSGGSSAACTNLVSVYGTFRLLSCKATPMGDTGVQFHATPSFCLFDRCAYAWDFGGSGSGSAVLTARPFFTYAAPGTYTASLTASTDGGNQSAACQVKVTVP